MRSRNVLVGIAALGCIAIGAACTNSTNGGGFDFDGGPGSSSSGGGSGGSGSGGNSSSGASSGGNMDGSLIGSGDGGSGGTVHCNVTDPMKDMDNDGWTPMQGDCNDCDPNVNPGAIDVLSSPDAGTPTWGDEDCDGTPGDSAKPCDMGLALDDVVAGDGAKAIELCRTATMSDRKYGVISANYVHSDGTAFAAPGLQIGLEPTWGTAVQTRAGATMLVLSSGASRSIGQTGACNGISCQIAAATAPMGFPQPDTCPPTPAIFDDVALEVQVRVPSNATGYAFNFKFYSFEFPDWVCDTKGYNDQFVALVNPPPMGAYVPTGSSFGNISFDSNNHPVSVNMGFFDVCDPTTPNRFASNCLKGSNPSICPKIPTMYCPLGTGELAGTGFDTWHTTVGPAGATRWLATTAPATKASIITIRFAMWDAGNGQFDSTTLIDNFHWIANGGTVAVGTQPVQ